LNARPATIVPVRDLDRFLTRPPPVLIRPRGPPRYAMERTLHPYRKLPLDRDARSASGEELILYAVLVVVGAIPVAAALVRGGAFGVEATIGLGMALAGVAGVWSRLAADRSDNRRPR
jgi:hypothetical protein